MEAAQTNVIFCKENLIAVTRKNCQHAIQNSESQRQDPKSLLDGRRLELEQKISRITKIVREI
jgi:hypothetical protein